MKTWKSRIGAVLIPLLPINRRIIDILRYEFSAVRAQISNRLSPMYYRQVSQLRARSDLSVNVGSGGKGLTGWVNIEMIRMRDTTLCLDIRRPLPLADQSVARLFAEHVVEHLDFTHDIPRVFCDWYRVMQSGGIVRIIVPDTKRFLEAYVAGEPKRWQAMGWELGTVPGHPHTPMRIVNHVFHQGGQHLFAYDFETLDWALRKAGFSEVEQFSHKCSQDPKLAIDQASHALDSLYVEARK
jgi:predicted SAM-dependent methyltransferase